MESTQRKRNNWTDAVKDAFKAEIRKGSSAAEIAKALNLQFPGLALSRNACIGFAHRNKLALGGAGQRVSALRPATPKRPYPKAPIARTVPKQAAPEGGRYYEDEEESDEQVRYITVQGKKRVRAPSLAAEEKRRILDRVTGREKPLFDIGADECRFPVGNLFCGDAVCRGAYCADHAAVCYIETSGNVSVPDESGPAPE